MNDELLPDMLGDSAREGKGADRMRRMIRLVLILLVICAPWCAEAEDLVNLGGDVTVEAGREVDSAVSFGGDVRVNGIVRNDAVAFGGSVFLGPGSMIKGNAVSFGGKVSIGQGAAVLGEITVFDPSRIDTFIRPLRDHWRDESIEFDTSLDVIPFIGLLVLALVTVAVAPRAIGNVSYTIEHTVLRSFFFGILGFAAVLPVAFMLLISIIGIILIPFEMLLVSIALFIGYVATAQLIGKKLFAATRMPDKPMLLETLVGSLSVWLAGMAPFVGWLFTVSALAIGFGGVISSLANRLLRKG